MRIYQFHLMLIQTPYTCLLEYLISAIFPRTLAVQESLTVSVVPWISFRLIINCSLMRRIKCAMMMHSFPSKNRSKFFIRQRHYVLQPGSLPFSTRRSVYISTHHVIFQTLFYYYRLFISLCSNNRKRSSNTPNVPFEICTYISRPATVPRSFVWIIFRITYMQVKFFTTMLATPTQSVSDFGVVSEIFDRSPPSLAMLKRVRQWPRNSGFHDHSTVTNH